MRKRSGTDPGCRRWRAAVVAVGLVLGAFCAGAPVSPSSAAESPEVPEAARDAVFEAAKALARKGYPAEMRELFALSSELGVPEELVLKESTRAEKRVAMVRKPARRLDDVARLLGKAADALLAPLVDPEVELAADDRADVARLVLRIDSERAEAREVLGHVHAATGWMPAGVEQCIARRNEVQEAILATRRLEVPITAQPSDSRLMRGLFGDGARMVKWGRVSIHTFGMPDAKAMRVLRESVRAVVFSRYLLTGKLALPVIGTDVAIDWMDTRPRYAASLDWLIANGSVSRTEADFKRKLGSFLHGAGRRVCTPRPEAQLETVLLQDLWIEAHASEGGGDPQATLQAGHLNWVCLAYLGAAMPEYGWKETTDAVRGTSDLDAEARRRHEMWRLQEAGLFGSRSWLAYLAEHDEDPAWSGTFVPEMGMIEGDDLLKATFVTQYLHEMGRLHDAFRATDDKQPVAAVFEEFVGGTLAAFETRWRAWLLAPDTRRGCIQRLGTGASAGEGRGDGTATPTTEQTAMLDLLHEYRLAAAQSNVRADIVPLAIDAELSRGCAAHALYLARHPEQAAAWPDAHEEWPDREGFSPAGSWAGLHSVIAPGCRTWRDAIDGWMGTFYHRLPLLDSGLVRVGWGFEKGMAVLDSGSMVGRFEYMTEVVWPPHRGKGLPRTFKPELPNPVPGEDQSKWGYPVTLQLIRYRDVPELDMSLREGRSRDGPEVECFRSTPQKPTNPEASTPFSWCLIPRAHLKPATVYTVVVTGLPEAEDLVWQFTTE